MFSKKSLIATAGLLGVLVLLAVFSRSALAVELPAPIRLDISLAPNIILEQVSIGEDRSVNVKGQVTNLSGSCLPVQVIVEGEREPWLPTYRCLAVSETGDWAFRIPSDDGGRPITIHLRAGE